MIKLVKRTQERKGRLVRKAPKAYRASPVHKERRAHRVRKGLKERRVRRAIKVTRATLER
jgi:hypothetical protein